MPALKIHFPPEIVSAPPSFHFKFKLRTIRFFFFKFKLGSIAGAWPSVRANLLMCMHAYGHHLNFDAPPRSSSLNCRSLINYLMSVHFLHSDQMDARGHPTLHNTGSTHCYFPLDFYFYVLSYSSKETSWY